MVKDVQRQTPRDGLDEVGGVVGLGGADGRRLGWLRPPGAVQANDLQERHRTGEDGR